MNEQLETGVSLQVQVRNAKDPSDKWKTLEPQEATSNALQSAAQLVTKYGRGRKVVVGRTELTERQVERLAKAAPDTLDYIASEITQYILQVEALDHADHFWYFFSEGQDRLASGPAATLTDAFHQIASRVLMFEYPYFRFVTEAYALKQEGFGPFYRVFVSEKLHEKRSMIIAGSKFVGHIEARDRLDFAHEMVESARAEVVALGQATAGARDRVQSGYDFMRNELRMPEASAMDLIGEYFDEVDEFFVQCNAGRCEIIPRDPEEIAEREDARFFSNE